MKVNVFSFATSLCFLLASATNLVAAGLVPEVRPAIEMRKFARAWFDLLSPEQQSLARLPYDSAGRVDWDISLAADRAGISLADMDIAQRTAALRFVRSALSEIGYKKVSRIMLSEDYLSAKAASKEPGDRDSLNYFLVFFGNVHADESSRWGFRFEGHRVSLNFTCDGDRVVGITPLVLGSLTNVTPESPITFRAAANVHSHERAFGFDLLRSLSDQQQRLALLSPKVPDEIHDLKFLLRQPGPPRGISYAALKIDAKYGDLKTSQKKLFRDLVDVYNSVVPQVVAEAQIKAIKKHQWDNVHLAWYGATEPSAPFYYCIQGPTLWIECIHAKVGSRHRTYTVWRDVRGDFGTADDQKSP